MLGTLLSNLHALAHLMLINFRGSTIIIPIIEIKLKLQKTKCFPKIRGAKYGRARMKTQTYMIPE